MRMPRRHMLWRPSTARAYHSATGPPTPPPQPPTPHPPHPHTHTTPHTPPHTCTTSPGLWCSLRTTPAGWDKRRAQGGRNDRRVALHKTPAHKVQAAAACATVPVKRARCRWHALGSAPAGSTACPCLSYACTYATPLPPSTHTHTHTHTRLLSPHPGAHPQRAR